MGYQYGDQLTTIICLQDAAGDVRPVWSRVILSSSDESDIFSDIAGAVIFEQSSTALAYSGVIEQVIGAVFIVSRWNGSKWLRSSQYVQVSSTYLEQFTSIEARAAAIASYQSGDSVVQSDVYLNGGTGTKAKANELVVKLVSHADWSSVGLAVPISVYSDVNNEPTILKLRDAANGATIYANVLRKNNRYVLVRRSDAHQFIRRTQITDILAEYIDMTSSAAFYNWLAKNGCAPNV